MGLLTRLIRRSTLRIMSLVFCTPELMPVQSERFSFKNHSSRATMQSYNSAQRGTLASVAEEEEEEQNNDNAFDNPRTLYVIRGVQGASVVFDLLDLVNAVLDLVFAVRLAKLPDATMYSIIVALGLVLGRIVLFRATWVLFQGGIQINQNLQGILQENSPFRGKNVVALQLLYCLAYSETAAFLLENYPSLATYAFWRTINSTPSPLERFDQINVIMTVVLCLTLASILLSVTLVLAAWQGYLRYKYACATWQDKVYHGSGLALGAVFVAAVITFMWQIISLAWRVTIWDERVLPSGDLLWGWISICEDVESMADRLSFCDERAFLIKTALAWMLAGYFAYFLFLEPATVETTDTSTQPTSLKATSQGAVHQRDDTSTSNSGADRVEDGEVEMGRTLTVHQGPQSTPDPSQSPSPRKVRSKPQNNESGTAQVCSPSRPLSLQPTTRRPSSMPAIQPPENGSHWKSNVPQSAKPIAKPTLHDSQYQVRHASPPRPTYRHRDLDEDEGTEPWCAEDPYGLGRSSPRARSVGPGFDTTKLRPNGPPKSLAPIKSEPGRAPTPPPDPFSSMAKFEAVLAAAETPEQKTKKSGKQVVVASDKAAPGPAPPPDPFSSMKKFEEVLAAAETSEQKARRNNKHSVLG